MEGSEIKLGHVGDAFAGGFQDGFFARPEGKECRGALLFGQGLQGCEFLWREAQGGDFVGAARVAELFDVDADGALTRDGHEDEVIGMGEIEVERGRWSGVGRSLGRLSEGGFAPGAVGKPQARGIGMKVTAQEGPEHSSAGNEPMAITFEGEAGGALGFVGRKC